MSNKPLLQIKDVSKSFPGVKALDSVSLDIYPGEITALVGENGAGKSTLVKILSGAYSKDEGELILADKRIEKDYTPLESRNLGIAIIYQELSLLSELSVAENIYISKEPYRFRPLRIIDYRTMFSLARGQLKKLEVEHVDVKKRLGSLPLPEQQMVEIAKALSTDCKLIIMDEPTTTLTWEETERLFRVMRTLKRHGVAVIYISHRMEEIFQICDRTVVMRDGKVMGSVQVATSNKQEIISMMTGKALEHRQAHTRDATTGRQRKEKLRVEHISDGKMLRDVSFTAYEGEILGFGGLLGSQRTELMRLLVGADKQASGKVFVEGSAIDNTSLTKTTKGLIGYLSENRKEEGLNLGLSIEDNIVLTNLNEVSKSGFIKNELLSRTAEEFIGNLSIKGRNQTIVKNLSGGNQQKVAIAKWLYAGCRVLIFDEPTRGIDVAAKAEIYGLIREFARQGNTALVVSSEVNELVDICDRVLVMSKGRIIHEIEGNDINQDSLLHAVTSTSDGENHE